MKPSFLESPSVAWWEPPAVRRRDLDDTGDSEMKNAGMAGAVALVGIGLSNFANRTEPNRCDAGGDGERGAGGANDCVVRSNNIRQQQ